MRVVPAIACLPALLAAALAGPQERPDVPTFSAQVDLVTVDVVVVDRQGRPVRGLAREDFTLSEDGRAQAIASFEAFDRDADEEGAASAGASGPVASNLRPLPAAARSFVLLVDDMGLAPTRENDVRKALAGFLSRGLRDGDELLYLTSSGDAWWTAHMPEGREDVLALAARIRGRHLAETANDYVSDWEAYRINNFEGPGGLAGGSLGAGPPGLDGSAGGPGPPPGVVVPSFAPPGSNITQRVVDRFLSRRVCDPYGLSMCYQLVRGRSQQVDGLRLNRTRDVLQAVDRAVFALTGLKGRKSLLLLSEGFLHDPTLSTLREVAGRCREANLAVYSIDVRGLLSGVGGYTAEVTEAPSVSEQGIIQMEESEFVTAGSTGLAEDMGGFAVRNTNDLAAGAARVVEESRVYYLLGFAPPEGKGSRDWRKLKVDTSRPGLRVRARKGYTLRSPPDVASRESASRKRKDERKRGPESQVPTVVERALSAGQAIPDIPLRATAYVFDDRPDGTARVRIALEADVAGEATASTESQPSAVFSLSIAATHRDSGKTFRLDQRLETGEGGAPGRGRTLATSQEFQLPPGVAQARIVVREERRGKMGAVSVRFEVPELAGLRLSTPILSDQVAPPVRAGAPPQPVLLARREFAAAGRLYCQYQVFGATPAPAGGGPQVLGGYRLRRTGGQLVREGTASLIAPTPDGRLVRLLGLSVDGMEAGDYELVLEVRDQTTGEMRERVEPLRLRLAVTEGW